MRVPALAQMRLLNSKADPWGQLAAAAEHQYLNNTQDNMPIGRATGQSDFNSREITLNPCRVDETAISLTLPLTLTKRTLWGMHFAIPSNAADWYVDASVTLLNGGGPVAEFP